MDAMDIQAVESKLIDITVTPIPMTSKQPQLPPQTSITIQPIPPSQQSPVFQHPNTSISPVTIVTTQTSANITTPMTNTNNIPSSIIGATGLSKYAQLLAVIEEMGRDIRPTYTGSRSSAERLKRGIIHSRILVSECLRETERSARQ